MLCWFPYACTSIAEVAGYKADTELSYYVLAIPAMMTKTSVCTDPIIYFYYNPQVTIGSSYDLDNFIHAWQKNMVMTSDSLF